MKVVTIAAAATLLFGASAAFAQTTSTKHGASTVRINKEARSARAQATYPYHARRMAPAGRGYGYGYGYGYAPLGRTQASDPNPIWNRNPDPEVPGSTLE